MIWADNETLEGPLHADFGLSKAGGEDIGLFDSEQNPIDSMIDFGPQLEDVSRGRLPDGSDNWVSFVYDSNTPPTPGKPNGSNPIDIVITEIMYHPSINPLNEMEEYIELYNQGIGPVNLLDWQFSDGVAFVFPDVTINPGEYLVVAADVAAFTSKYPGVSNVVGGWEGRLSNKSEWVELVDDGNMRVDRLRYADEGDWAVRELGPLDLTYCGWIWSDDHDGGGKSLELINLELPNDYGQITVRLFLHDFLLSRDAF